MFERKLKQPEGPVLLDRIIETGCRRVAILGLHPRAGARTVLSALVGETHRRQLPVAVTSVPRLPPEAELITAEPVTRIPLPAGAYVATAAGAVESAETGLELLESTGCETPLGNVRLYRVAEGGAVDLYGPDEGGAMSEILERLEELSGGTVLVEGNWDRRAFAAPGVTDGMVPVLGSGYSATPERSAAAARYHMETLSIPVCDAATRSAWEEAADRGVTALLDAAGRRVGVLPPSLEDPLPALRGPDSSPVGTVLLPYGLNDEFMMPLVRSTFRCALVVRDATRISVAPIYFKAWLKRRGRIHVVRPARLIAVATNPVNHAGPDADPAEFRRVVASALPDLHVHDVVLESGEEIRRPVWKFWQ